ncbi:Proline--tRNA ligase [Metamycoplasma cloacale]|uniref:Proline--tRNA ligase n=1 Tax=Metamycoplasma cloacale TaxID=92401 RepID=A0A2Z4LLE3_9BACT|nr:proline--tRNA ligase [Metamycoplasma cloacale]AWX42581.1 proline--tRNA ligase [Metamycoplasma cloacale]VEU79704.1 Proline--tRNA ligase [Metamycoplasma cloacale]
MKKLEKITPQNVDFAKWYTDVIKNGDLMAYGSTKGSIIFKPLSFGIWDNIRFELDKKFKAKGVQNVYLPLLIPESLLQKEKDHLQGFNPELATVTEVGGKKLSEKYFIRPTSETLFGEFFKNEVESYNDLPLIYNQWVNVLRWEKTTNPFLRTREFLWQEGHTVHNNKEEAVQLTWDMLEIYRDFLKEYLALPVLCGQKTEHEKFSGADFTLTVEAMMKDGKALQGGTSHYLGQNFTKAFDISFKNKNNETEFAYGTSWGVSTRLLGALIMTHGDDRGIIIPPKIAPTQVDVIELFANKEEKVAQQAKLISDALLNANIRAKIDNSDKNPGFKAANSEIHGTPLRIEIGPKDVQENQVILVRRDTLEKNIVKINDMKEFIDVVLNKLNSIQNDLYNAALDRLNHNFVEVSSYDEFKEAIASGKWVLAPFEGSNEDEDVIKNETGASTRCIPFKLPIEIKNDTCFYTKKKTKRIVAFAKAY